MNYFILSLILNFKSLKQISFYFLYKAEERANKYEVHSQELETTLNDLEGKLQLYTSSLKIFCIMQH